MKRHWWVFPVPLLILASLAVWLSWQRKELKQSLRQSQEQAAKIRADFFLSQSRAAPATQTVTVTATATSTATTTSAGASWPDPGMPDYARAMHRYSAPTTRARQLLSRPPFSPAANTAPSARVELDDRFAHTISTVEGLTVNQMFDRQSGQLLSERWQDPQLGQVVRSYHPDLETVSLTAENTQQKVELTPIPAEQVEYLVVQEPDQGFVSILERGRRTTYWSNLSDNRFVEYQDGEPSRQWQRVGENRFQEIDENGRRLSVYRVEPESGEIVLVE